MAANYLRRNSPSAKGRNAPDANHHGVFTINHHDVSQATNNHHDVSTRRHQLSVPESYPTVLEKFTSYRYKLCYMLIFGLALIQSQQNNMAFALVCMTGGIGGNSSKLNVPNNVSSSTNGSLYRNISNATSLETDNSDKIANQPEFTWDSATQGRILSSTFYAATVSPFVSSWLSRLFGPKIVIGTAMGISGLSSLLTPVAARTNFYLAIVCRVVMGFFLNTILPASQDLWVHWAPVQDKAQLMALTFTGNNIANIVTFSVSGFLCTIPIDNGWPFIFYVFGSLAICWCLLWSVTIHGTPESHPSISNMEIQYILQNRQGVTSEKKPKIPWKGLLTSPPFWCIVLTFFCHIWTSALLFNFLPTYTVLEFEITQNGLLSSVPYITRLVGMVSWTVVSGNLIRHLSFTATRKTIQAIGSIGAAILTLGIVFVPVHLKAVAVVLFALVTPLQSASVSGAIVTIQNIAPQFASVTTAFGTVAAVLAQLLSPIVTSLIIVDRTKEQWNIVFYLSTGMYILALTVFLIFGSAEVQPWAVTSRSPSEPKNIEAQENKVYQPDTGSDTKEKNEEYSNEFYDTHL